MPKSNMAPEMGVFQIPLAAIDGRTVFEGDKEFIEFRAPMFHLDPGFIGEHLEARGISRRKAEQYIDIMYEAIQADQLGEFFSRHVRQVG